MSKLHPINPELEKIVWDVFMTAARTGQFFSVTFERENDKKEKGVIIARKGEVREMLCRVGVKKYTVGKTDEERRENQAYGFRDKGVLPVWDVQKFQENKGKGMSDEEAGKRAYRSFKVANILKISLLP